MLPVQDELPVLADGALTEAGGSQNLEAQAASGVEGKVGGRVIKNPYTLPRYDQSPASPGSRDEARVKVRLASLRMESQEKAQDRQAQLKFQLEVRKLEIEADTAVRLRQMELESKGRFIPPDLDEIRRSALNVASGATLHTSVWFQRCYGCYAIQYIL